MTNQLEVDDPLYTVREVADICKVTPWTVVNLWIKGEKLKATKVGSRWRIPKSELVKFLNERYGTTGGR
jgi:excisionase family DNA binding protein